MLTHEETKILGYLRKHWTSPLSDVIRVCLPGAQPEWAKRVLADLEWLGYIVVYYDQRGEPLALQSTEKGRSAA
jgi:hypothetical protein